MHKPEVLFLVPSGLLHFSGLLHSVSFKFRKVTSSLEDEIPEHLETWLIISKSKKFISEQGFEARHPMSALDVSCITCNQSYGLMTIWISKADFLGVWTNSKE